MQKTYAGPMWDHSKEKLCEHLEIVIKFATSAMIANQINATILIAIKQVTVYSKRGFVIIHLLMDREFESMRGDLAGLRINLNVTSNNEHVPEIERHIRTF
jgi:hypothetical protein